VCEGAGRPQSPAVKNLLHLPVPPISKKYFVCEGAGRPQSPAVKKPSPPTRSPYKQKNILCAKVQGDRKALL